MAYVPEKDRVWILLSPSRTKKVDGKPVACAKNLESLKQRLRLPDVAGVMIDSKFRSPDGDAWEAAFHLRELYPRLELMVVTRRRGPSERKSL